MRWPIRWTSPCCCCRAAEVSPPRQTRFPVLQGRIRAATGHLGAFTLTRGRLCGCPRPRRAMRCTSGRRANGATSRADLVIDLTGGTPLFPALICGPAICAPIPAIRRPWPT